MANISFEFFPPKTDKGRQKLQETAKKLTHLKPEFFSVTFGAGGSTQQGTLDTVTTLKQLTGINTAPHLSCVGSKKAELVTIINQYKDLGLNRIVALRGDLPSGMGNHGDLKNAKELVQLIRETSGDHFQIEVAAYPEYHPQAKNALLDLKYFKEKVDAGADSAITQYFYNPDAYFYFLEQCQRYDIKTPIIPGIMPITNYSKLVQFSNSCGAEIPRWILKRLHFYGDDIESIKAFGIEVVYNLCEKLLAGGAPGLHFYTLNSAEASLKVCELVLSILDKPQTTKEKIL